MKIKPDVLSVCQIRTEAKRTCVGCVYREWCKKRKITKNDVKNYLQNLNDSV